MASCRAVDEKVRDAPYNVEHSGRRNAVLYVILWRFGSRCTDEFKNDAVYLDGVKPRFSDCFSLNVGRVVE
jgi:hypothetical protein